METKTESELWLIGIIETRSRLKELLAESSFYNSLMVYLQEYICDTFDSLASTPVTLSPAHTSHQRDLAIFFKRVLEEVLVKEQSNQPYTVLLTEGNFTTSLLACCVEVYFYVHMYSGISFSYLLECLRVHSFNFWKQLGRLFRFHPVFPKDLVLHLKRLEECILMSLAWKGESELKRYIKSREIENPKSFNAFFTRVIEVVANRIFVICKHLEVGETVQGLIWETSKHFLSGFTIQLELSLIHI